MADALALRQAMTQVKINIGHIGPLPADFQIMVQPMVKGLAQGQGVCAVDALVVASTLPEYG